MVLTNSNMLPLGTTAPDFTLPDPINGGERNLNELKSDQATVVMFICNHCPYVVHVKPELKRIAEKYTAQGVSFIAISSNDVKNYPDDAPELMADEGYPFPYLYDESQAVAKSYRAACTPDIYVFDADMKLVYRGQLDDSRPGNEKPLDGHDLRTVLDAILAGTAINQDQKPSSGCNIKWKA